MPVTTEKNHPAKRVFSFIMKTFKENTSFWMKALLVGAFLILAAQFAALSGYIAQSATTQSVVQATDNDAGNSIGVGLRTHLWNDNHWNPYGPVYYRLAAFIGYFTKDAFKDPSFNEAQSREKNRHFVLMLVSLISLFTAAFVIARFFTNDLFLQILSTVALTAAFLADPTWSVFIFRVHPDHTLVLTIAALTTMSLYWLSNRQNEKWLQLSAIAWGVAASTKLSILLFGPALIVLFYPWNRKAIQMFLAYMFLAFFVVGFPQNFDIFGPLKFLKTQSRNVLPPDFNSIAGWASLFKEQLWRPLLVLFGIVLFSANAPFISWSKNRRLFFQAVCFLTVPTLVLFSRKIISAHHYYPMPFVITLLFLAGLILQNLLRFEWMNLHFHPFLQRPLGRITTLVLFAFVIQPVPQEVHRVVAEQDQCRPEAAKVEEHISKASQQGHKVLVDPYVPYRPKDPHVREVWGTTLKHLEETGPQLIVLKNSYNRRYLSSDPFQTEFLSDLEAIRDFYGLFFEKTSTVDPAGHRWTKIHEDACTWSVWQRGN